MIGKYKLAVSLAQIRNPAHCVNLSSREFPQEAMTDGFCVTCNDRLQIFQLLKKGKTDKQIKEELDHLPIEFIEVYLKEPTEFVEKLFLECKDCGYIAEVDPDSPRWKRPFKYLGERETDNEDEEDIYECPDCNRTNVRTFLESYEIE